MLKSVAVLLDGGFVDVRLRQALGSHPTAMDIWSFACRCIRDDREEIFRIFYYDCPPLDRRATNPLSGKTQDLGRTETARRKSTLQRELAKMDLIAFRAGELTFNGWDLSREAYDRVIEARKSGAPVDLQAEDLRPDIKQKRVDMMIGLDIAWLASRRLVDRLILVAGDSDFIPAMKFARREGVQVVLVPLKHNNLSEEMRMHADEVRDIPIPLPAPPLKVPPG